MKRILCLMILGLNSAQADNLLDLYDLTVSTHPIVKGHEFSIDQARAQKDIALSKLLPQVSATGVQSWNKMTSQSTTNTGLGMVTTDYPGTRGMIQAKQSLFDLPSFLQWQSADSVVLQAEFELDAARMSLVADLVERYFQVLQEEDSLKYIEGEKHLTESDSKRIRRMSELQLRKVTDLYEVEAYYQTLLTEEIKIKGDREIALEKLHEMAGRFVTEVSPLNLQVVPKPDFQIAPFVEDALARHPALRALSYGLEAADKQVDSQRAGHLPQFSLQVSDTYADNSGYDNRNNSRYEVGTVGVQVNVPIFSGGGIEASVDKAVASYQVALEKRNEKLREIEREIRTAYVQLKTSFSRIDSMAKEVEAREKVTEAQSKSYDLGVITIVDLLEVKKELLKSRFGLGKARYEYVKQLVALKLWSGSLQRSDVEEINGWLNKG